MGLEGITMMKDALRSTIVSSALGAVRTGMVVLLAYLCAMHPLSMIACCLVGILLGIWYVYSKVQL